MNNVMVSIRMPYSLASELKVMVKTQNFLDLSEEVRGIVRQKWMSSTNPELFEIKKLRENIEHNIRQKSAKRVHEEVAKELDKIKSQLKKEGILNEK